MEKKENLWEHNWLSRVKFLLDYSNMNDNDNYNDNDDNNNNNNNNFELRERREGFTVNIIPTIIGCLGGGIKELKESLKRIFENDNDKELESLAREMQKTVLWESESNEKSTVWTVDMMKCLFHLTNKFW